MSRQLFPRGAALQGRAGTTSGACRAQGPCHIEELLEHPVPDNYVDYLRLKMGRVAHEKSIPAYVQKTSFQMIANMEHRGVQQRRWNGKEETAPKVRNQQRGFRTPRCR